MSSEHASEDIAARIERKWAVLVLAIMCVLVAMVIFTGLHWAMMPPSRVETIRPETLNVTGEFIESKTSIGIQSGETP